MFHYNSVIIHRNRNIAIWIFNLQNVLRVQSENYEWSKYRMELHIFDIKTKFPMNIFNLVSRLFRRVMPSDGNKLSFPPKNTK